MTVVTQRLTWGSTANGGEYYLYVTYDSRLEDQLDDGTYVVGDPAATGLVSEVRYKNTGATEKTIIVGGRTFIAAAGTPDTTINIPTGQRPNIYTTSWSVF